MNRLIFCIAAATILNGCALEETRNPPVLQTDASFPKPEAGPDAQGDAQDASGDVVETVCVSPYTPVRAVVACDPGMSCIPDPDAGVHGICVDCELARPFCLDVNHFVNCDCKGCGAVRDCRTDSPPPGFKNACLNGNCSAPW